MKSKHPFKSPVPGPLLLAALLCASAAVCLRCWDCTVRNAITQFIGADRRALLEHFLAALAVPLGLHSFLLCAADGRPGRTAPWRNPMPGRWPGPSRLACAAAAASKYAPFIWAGVYLMLCIRFEMDQATVSVYGGAPRVHVQYGQLMADAAGAVLAAALAWRTTAGR
jgi:hypothetical protein